MKKTIIVLTVLFVIFSIFYISKNKEEVEIPDNDLIANNESVIEGYLLINVPGLERDVWHLLYEEPGKPALSIPLLYEDKSNWEPGMRVKITGIEKEEKFEVISFEKIEEGEKDNIEPISIGGEKDEYGCFISAGYTFCKAKERCVRIWEEGCGITSIPASSNNVPDNEDSCREMKGEWGIFGLSLLKQCNLPTSDAIKNCYNESDCEGSCIAKLSSEEEIRVKKGESIEKTGKCSMWLNTYGCNAFVNDGKVSAILCVD
ncbi:MAG: hypothetical protein PHH17_02405 [Candidatus Pacebacteria bacterium]|nr:hypothetical protein [Candidatus Paceibacterota bacterium]MDD3072236.1 hypothetical protein [Candidatus Paceibacterota bacterium]MDD3729063.1 hypothetical protein [Candidatus Paceibacterota bacterium]MDD4201193.1 hypothetical protein [Candidatus Paceibacterota bacterium]MDD4467308.1 hypothetical protein [Candidatus Paceibacterota bacterium]